MTRTARAFSREEWLLISIALSEKALVAQTARRMLDDGTCPAGTEAAMELASRDLDEYKALALKLAATVIDPHQT